MTVLLAIAGVCILGILIVAAVAAAMGWRQAARDAKEAKP